MTQSTEIVFECMGGPMDGERVAQSVLKHGMIRLYVHGVMCTLVDGTRLFVYQSVRPKNATLSVVYQQRPEAHLHHLHYVRSEPCK